jgi:hypothetical protein
MSCMPLALKGCFRHNGYTHQSAKQVGFFLGVKGGFMVGLPHGFVERGLVVLPAEAGTWSVTTAP